MYAGAQSLLGTVIGGMYRLERLLGEGGMGSVYEAQHLRLPRRFAVKLLNQEVLGNKNAFERFQREAEIASALGDPHIVQVFDFNHTADGLPYMVLELLEGEDLWTRLQRGRLTLAETATFLEQVASALTVAHRNGIVHRDLNPRNVYLCRVAGRDDFVKVLDFGISKVLDPQHTATVTGAIMGTPNYMSPEQAQGKQSEIDHRTDIFALGAMLYECLSQRRAFEAPTLVGALYQVCHGEPEPLTSLVPGLPPAVAEVIGLAMAKRKEDRPHSVKELYDDFMLACGGGQARAASMSGAVVPESPDDAPTMVAGMPAMGVPLTAALAPVPTTLGGAAGETGVGLRARRRRRLGLVLALGVAAMVVVVAVLAGGGRKKTSTRPSTSTSTSPSTSTSTSTSTRPSTSTSTRPSTIPSTSTSTSPSTSVAASVAPSPSPTIAAAAAPSPSPTASPVASASPVANARP
ncbi:MAG: serine/threonine protein kinase, partial [Deltaproteobacteria bacterium]|nr:serine/threonine protein kinase [Deltaproteobacteria bacterium]